MRTTLEIRKKMPLELEELKCVLEGDMALCVTTRGMIEMPL